MACNATLPSTFNSSLTEGHTQTQADIQAVLCVTRSTLACGYTALEVLMSIILQHPDFQHPSHLRTNSTDTSRKRKVTSSLQHHR
jgi:hypothetical protein